MATAGDAQRTKYESWSRNELIDELLRRNRPEHLGISWDRSRGDEAARDLGFPVMQADAAASCGAGPYENLVIEGDNLHALGVLHATHRGRIDCIFIDPPYNTGATDFVYNDDYVGREDAWRHSKWLTFLEPRLRLGAELLSEAGVMLVCINDENRAKLEMLMDRVWPGRRIGSLTWRSRAGSGEAAASAGLASDHEHILVYAGPRFRFQGVPKDLSAYKNKEGDDRWGPDNLTKTATWEDRPNAFFPLKDPDTDVWYPCNPERVWAHARTDAEVRSPSGRSMEWLLRNKRVLFPKNPRVQVWRTLEELLAAIDAGDVPTGDNGNRFLRRELPDIEQWVGRRVGWGTPLRKKYVSELKSLEQQVSSWLRPSTEAWIEEEPESDLDGERDELNDDDSEEEPSTPAAEAAGLSYNIREGGRTLSAIFGRKVFSYPKPETLVRAILRQAMSRDALVLDYFAGSGTTGHAVLQLNAEDGGRRRFILVSSTEATETRPEKNLCRDVCAERVRRVVTGYQRGRRRVRGLGGDFAYLRMSHVAWAALPYAPPHAFLWLAAQLESGVALQPYDEAAAFQANAGIFYLADASADALSALSRAVTPGAKVWAWAPRLVEDALLDRGASVLAAHALLEAVRLGAGRR